MESENNNHASILKLIVPNHYTFIEFKFGKDWAIFWLRYFFLREINVFFTRSNLGGQKMKDSNYFLENKDIEPTEWLKMLSKKVLTRKNMILAPDIPKIWLLSPNVTNFVKFWKKCLQNCPFLKWDILA